MFSYKVTIAVVTTMALLRSPVVIAQDIAEVNNIAINISVKITGHSNGSGFILEREGNVYSVVTNKHVVPVDTEYEIQTYDGTKHQVTNRQEIPDLDLAIIQFSSTEEYEVAELGNSDELEQRQFISVAGFPGEQTDLDIIDGQIRSIRQEIIANPEPNQGYALIYTNQTLPGSSGGAVLDEKGRVVAINGEVSIDNKTGRDVSRGIPINLFLEAEEQLLATENNPSVTTSNLDNYFDSNIRWSLESLDTYSSTNNSPATTSNRASSIDSNTSFESNNSSNYQLAYSTPVSENHNAGVDTVAITGDYFISGSRDKTVKVWNLTTGELERTLSGHGFRVVHVAVSGDKIVSGSLDKTIKVWSIATGKLERTFNTNFTTGVSGLAVSNDKVIGSGTYTIKVWNLTTGELERTLSGHSDLVYSSAVSGDKIVSGSGDKTIKVWNLTTGELERTLTGHNGSVTNVAVSEEKIVSGSNDKTIKVWNLATGELERTLTLTGDSNWVSSVAVSGDKIFSASDDNTIKVWNLATGELEQTLTGHDSWVSSVVISGDKIISGSSDGTIKMWQLQN